MIVGAGARQAALWVHPRRRAVLRLRDSRSRMEAALSDSGIRLAPAYDWRISVKKALGEFARDVLVFGGGTITAYLLTPGNAESVMTNGVPWTFVGASMLVAAGRAFQNWQKNRDR